MPRPPLPDHVKRKERRFYSTDPEWERIESVAAALNLSASEFARQATLSACDRHDYERAKKPRRL